MLHINISHRHHCIWFHYCWNDTGLCAIGSGKCLTTLYVKNPIC